MASRKLEDCVPELQEKIPLIITDYNTQFPDRKLFIVCTLRSIEEQQAIYAIGRTTPPIGAKYIRTKNDGIEIPSKHNPIPEQPLSRAVDFGVLIGGKYMVNDEFYKPLLELARRYELRSGWDFRESGLSLEKLLKNRIFKDPPHVELSLL